MKSYTLSTEAYLKDSNIQVTPFVYREYNVSEIFGIPDIDTQTDSVVKLMPGTKPFSIKIDLKEANDVFGQDYSESVFSL